ncbi:hypothetical protein [Saccharothrix deserti]|uniref:hypothetical protein n=1 Tax=Saccharothrix deserti TaxID=2593674 RepID=UPI00131B2A39|nr:hypothetical protein [Saccharothrix deserti]
MTPSSPFQFILAKGGIAYGVIDGDLHIHPEHRTRHTFHRVLAPGNRPRTSPSAVELGEWADHTADRLAVRWLWGATALLGPTLDSFVAARLAADNLVVAAIRPSDQPGLLTNAEPEVLLPRSGQALVVIVDTEEWSVGDTAWLLSDGLLHHPGVRTRVVLVADSPDDWPPTSALITDPAIAASAQECTAAEDVLVEQQRRGMHAD